MRIAILFILASLSHAAEAPVAPVIILEDQFQRKHALGEGRGDVVLLIYGDRHSATANQQFGSTLHVHFHPTAKGQPPAQASRAPVRAIENWPAGTPLPDVKVEAIACAGKVPGVVANLIRSQLRSKSPDIPVCLDFEDKLKQFYGMTKGVTNLVVLDTKGRVRYQANNALNAAQVQELIQFIERLRLEAR